MPYFWPLLPPPAPPPGPTPTPFVALQGAPLKSETIKQLVPPWMEVRYPSLLGAILHAIGVEDHRVTVGDRTLFIRGASPAGNVLYVAKSDDPAIRVKHIYPTMHPAALSISVAGKDIIVSLSTDGSGVISTTALLLRTTLAATPAADALVGLTTFGAEDKPVGATADFIPLDPDGLEGARRDILLDYARGDNLVIIGGNYGVAKPYLLSLTDDKFRQYIAALALQKKCSRGSIESILTAIFGPRATAGWEVYESLRRKTITIEVVETLLPTGAGVGTFLRPLSVVAPPASTPQNSQAFYTGDYLRASAATAYVPSVKPTTLDPVSSVFNNSPYVRGRSANRPVLLDVMKLVKAAGVRVEFVQRKG